jgi:UPF0755 protein
LDDKKTNSGENKPEVKAPEISSPEKGSPVDRIRHLTQKQMAALGCGLFALLILAGGFYFYAVDRPSLSGKVTISVPKEATGTYIADMLEKKGVIKSSEMFCFYMRILGDGTKLQSGVYSMHQGLSIREAAQELKSGKADTVTVTIPEGSTVRQMGEIFAKSGIAGTPDFVKEASTYGPLPYMYGPVAAPVKGEGFLFADTYSFPLDYTARQICDVMYKRTNEMLTPEIRREAEAKHMTLHDLITIASMVEREAKFKEDQVPIASVILKRLEVGMPLQIDATVQYALGAQKEELTVADTKIDSPYNTYIHPGLPPGPIGSPGMEAIRAVLKAQPGEYLYYVAKEDGHHVFTKTYDEHRAETETIYGSSS